MDKKKMQARDIMHVNNININTSILMIHRISIN